MMLLKALKNILTLGVVLLAIATMFAAWSVRLEPTEAGRACLAWFAFPYLWVLVAAVGVVCFAFKSWFQFLCCLTAAVATWGSARLVIDIPSGGTDGSDGLKIVTYNVHYMGYGNEVGYAHARDSICSFLLGTDADIICLQESPNLDNIASPTFAHGLGVRLLEKYPYKLTGSDPRIGQLILSKHNMTEAPGTRTEFDKAERRGAIIAADIRIGSDTLRVFNCHLASLALSDKEIEAVSSDRDDDGDRVTRLRHTYEKMTRAFTERQNEVEILKRVIGATKTRALVCGDFNDTPISYTYHTLTTAPAPLSDSRRPKGLGLANTYRGALPPLRIDYILATDGVATSCYAEHDLPTSDHKAVSASFSL